MPKGFFITGTDTGVGKTVITAALIKAAGILGLKACGMKPIETGCLKQKFNAQDGNLIPHDGELLRNISGAEESIDLITPVCFENSVAPLPAAEIERKFFDLEKIKKAFIRLAADYDAVIVEGIGGLLVPIRGDYFVLDLAKDFGLPVIVVSRPGLGTINHTLLTVNYAMKERLQVAGIIINYSSPPEGSLAENTNADVIKRVSPVPLIGIFPYLKSFEGTAIEKTAAKSLNLQIIKKYLDQL